MRKKLFLITCLLILLTPLFLFFSIITNQNSLSNIKAFYWVWAGQDNSNPNIGLLKKFCSSQAFCELEEPHIHIITFDNNNKFNYHLNKNLLESLGTSKDNMILTFRLEKLPNVYDVGDIYYKYTSIFNNYGFKVDGIEIDYDSPSYKITTYLNWLKKLSLILNNKPIEITGLRTWVDDNKLDTIELLNEVKKINFQLYQNDENIFPPQSFFKFINNNVNAHLAIICNDFKFLKRVLNNIDKTKNLSIGFFNYNSCHINNSDKY